LQSEGVIGWDDLVFGPSGQDASEIGDKIIRRSDGGALFHLAVVVDDIDMEISHVIRGADHHPNTPFQIAIYDALGATPPAFAHVPLIVGPSGKKLSKRRDPVSIEEYRDKGLLPDGLRNWLIRLGWSHGDDEIFSREEIVRKFDLDGVGRASGQADPDKLLWVNQQHLKTASMDTLIEALAPHFEQQLGHVPVRDERLTMVIELMRDRAKTLIEMAELASILLREEVDLGSEGAAKAVKKHLKPAALPFVQALYTALEKLDSSQWTEAKLETIFEEVAASNGDVKLGKIAQPVRVAVTGGPVSPGIYETMIAIGPARCMTRLANALDFMRKRAADAAAANS
jgi:glutamyl-tRNA synthetase